MRFAAWRQVDKVTKFFAGLFERQRVVRGLQRLALQATHHTLTFEKPCEEGVPT